MTLPTKNPPIRSRSTKLDFPEVVCSADGDANRSRSYGCFVSSGIPKAISFSLERE